MQLQQTVTILIEDMEFRAILDLTAKRHDEKTCLAINEEVFWPLLTVLVHVDDKATMFHAVKVLSRRRDFDSMDSDYLGWLRAEFALLWRL
jgi:hypothetical protein